MGVRLEVARGLCRRYKISFRRVGLKAVMVVAVATAVAMVAATKAVIMGVKATTAVVIMGVKATTAAAPAA